MTTRLRHRPAGEEEDAAALKLGPGATPWPAYLSFSYIHLLEEFNNAGCLLISEVKYLLENRDKDAPDTACVQSALLLVYISNWITVYTTRRSNMSRLSRNSTLPIPLVQSESMPLLWCKIFCLTWMRTERYEGSLLLHSLKQRRSQTCVPPMQKRPKVLSPGSSILALYLTSLTDYLPTV